MRNVRLALLWHMHQPPYREAETGEYLMPWVRLHATRAYSDMAWILERHPGVRCMVNFTPILLEQLEDYVEGRAHDRFLELSARPPAELGPEERQAILRSFFMVDWERHIRPVPRYWDLLQKRGRDVRSVDVARLATAFSDDEITDLQVHFNLAWMGFAALADDEGLRALRAQGGGFGREDVEYVLAVQRRMMAEVVPRWRRLAERGQVELSTTPYYHPILPLLCDTDAARRALPGIPLPPRFAHPEDARWHVREAIASHARRFGAPPAGMWPAEGSVSPEALEVLQSEGVRWAASDEGVLLHSVAADAPRLRSLYRPWKVAAGSGELAMLFRDRSLSDVIGFTYAKVAAKEAGSDFVSHGAAIGVEAKPLREPTFLLTPTLDGRETTFFEWQGSGLYRPGQHRGSMYGGAQAFHLLQYGFDLQALHLRLDPAESPARAVEVATRVRVVVLAAQRQTAIDFGLVPDGRPRPGLRHAQELGQAAFAQVLEISIPFAELGLAPGMKLAISVHTLRGEVEVERLPRYGFLAFTVPDVDFEHVNWRV